MSQTEIRRCTNADEIARVGAQITVQALAQSGEKAFLGLSGGRIAQGYCRALAEVLHTSDLLRRLHVFWVDERCVPPDDPESNYAIAAQWLIVPLGLPENQVHRIPGELDPHQAARAAQADLLQVNGGSAPVFDALFLGMGEDGHTASLFPGDSTPVDDVHLYRAVKGPKPPPWRVTMGYNLLAAARETIVLVSGSAKAGALKASLSGAATPLGRVLARRTSTKVVTDF